MRVVNPLRLFCFLPLALFACVFHAQTAMEEFGPYNVNVLRDGPALSKPLDDKDSLSGHPQQVFAGDGNWAITFWFKSTEPLTGRMLLAGYGDPAAQDARYIAIENGHLALWLGSATGAPLISGSGITDGWHFVAASAQAGQVTLFLDDKEVLTSRLVQGSIAPRLEVAPTPPAHFAGTHFGGKIAAFKIYSLPLSEAQVSLLFNAPPDYEHVTYEEASPTWHYQSRAGTAGLTAPQDPSTLPRAKTAPQKPVAKPLTTNETKTHFEGTGPWKIRGGWSLIAAPSTNATPQEISRAGYDARNWMVATVPGTVLTTMIDRGIYPDPDYGLNNMAIPESLAHQDYWYRVEFGRPAGVARASRLLLTLEGVNYAAEIWLNGHQLGKMKGAFQRGSFDVTSLLSASGLNALAVRVSPPPHPGIAHEQSIKAGPGDNGGIQMLDGPTFEATEGWDWIPGIRDRNTGIWQDVTLTATGTVHIGDANVVTVLPRQDLSEADIEIEVPLDNAGNTEIDGELVAAFDEVKITRKIKLAPGQSVVRLTPREFEALRVQHPRLWWPNGYGEPALHGLTLRFVESGAATSEAHTTFGMREVSYETSLFDPDGHLHRVEVLPARTYDAQLPLIDERHEAIRRIDDHSPNLTAPGEKLPEWMRQSWVQSLAPGAEHTASIRELPNDWPSTDLVIKVNGVRIAARGGNWGMDDSRKRVSIEHLEPYFRLHREAHVNMIRNWMGQNTEENFYALADKYGLMVWNDFWESTEDWNLEAEDPALFLANARDAILHFRHHPSIVVWCGRNEGVPQPILNEGMAGLVRTLDHTRYYTGSSNQVNLRNSGPYQYQDLDAYYRINRGFSVELGIPSVPTLEALKSFIPPADLWPISDTWSYHDWHISGNGAVAPFLEHMEKEFGTATSLEDFERKAQMLDYVGHRAIFEGMAAHLWQPNSARLIWMTQPAWPSMEWNFLGSDYDTQSSYYASKKAMEPVHAQLNLVDNSVDLIRLGADTASIDLDVTARVFNLEGKLLAESLDKIHAAPNARTPVTKLNLPQLAAGHTVLVKLAVASNNGIQISDNLYWWAADEGALRELNSMPPVRLDATAHEDANDGERHVVVALKNNSQTPALLVKLTLENGKSGERILPAYLSDNYFSLLPGEEKTVTVDFEKGAATPGFGLRGWNLVEQKIPVK